MNKEKNTYCSEKKQHMVKYQVWFQKLTNTKHTFKIKRVSFSQRTSQHRILHKIFENEEYFGIRMLNVKNFLGISNGTQTRYMFKFFQTKMSVGYFAK